MVTAATTLTSPSGWRRHGPRVASSEGRHREAGDAQRHGEDRLAGPPPRHQVGQERRHRHGREQHGHLADQPQRADPAPLARPSPPQGERGEPVEAAAARTPDRRRTAARRRARPGPRRRSPGAPAAGSRATRRADPAARCSGAPPSSSGTFRPSWARIVGVMSVSWTRPGWRVEVEESTPGPNPLPRMASTRRCGTPLESARPTSRTVAPAGVAARTWPHPGVDGRPAGWRPGRRSAGSPTGSSVCDRTAPASTTVSGQELTTPRTVEVRSRPYGV